MSARAALVVLAALVLAAPAGAAGELRLGRADTSGYPTVRVSVVTPEPTRDAPAIRENGKQVSGLTAENLGRSKTVAFAIDRSRSMRGDAIEDARQAAQSFVAAKPPGDRLGLFAFGKQATQLTSFSTATIDADAALDGLAVDTKQGTALYDAIVLAARALANEPYSGRILVVVTDGDDVSSEATLSDAIEAAGDAKTSVYAVGIESRDFSPEPLQQLSQSTGGRYYAAATSSALEEIYTSIADELQRTWMLTYRTEALTGETAKIAVAAAGATAAASIRMPGTGGTSTSRPEPSAFIPGFLYERNLGTMLIALFSGAITILAFGLLIATPGSERLRRRIDPHAAVIEKQKRRAAPRERFAAATGVLLATEKSLSKLRFWGSLHRMLERADLPLRTVEFFYICAGAGILLGLFAAVAAAPSLVILFLMAFGAGMPVLYVWFKARQRMIQLDDQLPDILITIAASLKAGHSFRQGIQAVVDEGQPPAAAEFKRVLTETSLGRPMDDALDEMAERIGSKNLTFVITAVTIQRQVGGSLATIFDMVADAVRQRQQFARKIRALTAMGRMSAYTLIALPFVIAGAITVLNRSYMEPLYATSTGHLLIAMTGVMMLFGTVILKKIVSMKG